MVVNFTPTALSFVSKTLGGSATDYNVSYLPPGSVHASVYNDVFLVNATYDEGGHENMLFRTSDMTNLDGGTGTHGSGTGGGNPGACHANATYAFFSVVQGTSPGIIRKNYPSMTFAGGFTGATGFSGAVLVIGSSLTGLICDASELYVADSTAGVIRVLTASTMVTARTLTVASAGHLALASDGNIWCVTGSTVKKINKTTGATMITLTPPATPKKVWVLADGSVCVSSDVTFRVYIYNSSGTLTENFGLSGGLYANNGLLGGAVFGPIIGFHRVGGYSYVIWWAGADSGTVVTKHDSTGAVVASFTSMFFLETPTLDSSFTTMWSRMNRFAFDPTADDEVEPPQAVTYFPANALADYRSSWFTVSTYYREIGGRKYLFHFSQNGTKIVITEIIDGVGRLRPAGLQQSNDTYFSAIWVPPDDGTAAPPALPNPPWDLEPAPARDWIGLYPDEQGTLWRTGLGAGSTWLQKTPCGGLDAHNNPIYRWADMTQENVSLLIPGGTPLRFLYDAASDTGYLCGDPNNPPADYTSAGTLFRCYDNWSTTRTLRWELTVTGVVQAVAISENYFALGYRNLPIASLVSLYRNSDGQKLSDMQSTGSTGVNLTFLDTFHAIRIHEITPQNVVVIAEREIGGACLMYQCDVTGHFSRTTRPAVQQVMGVDYAA